MSTKNNLSRITIDIPKKDHQRLKAMAALQGKSMREIVIESIEDRLDRSTETMIPEDIKLQKAIEDVLKKYAPALKKLADS